MRIYWLNPPISVRTLVADTAWINFSAVLNSHEWITPIIDWEPYETVDDVVAEIVSHSPDILCMSTYLWNERLCLEVAAQLKDSGIVIVRGGPHQTGFQHIHYNCPPLATGEVFLKVLLDNLSKGNTEHPSLAIKQKYDFPASSTLEYNIEYLTNVAGTAKKLKKTSVAHLETTRGCPYSCTYCEWGGGIGTKISQKPFDVVIKEVDLLSVLGYGNVDIIDANFGILSRDVSIIQRIADNKKMFGYPKNLLIYGIAKVKAEKREQILDIVFKNSLMDYYSLSIQTTSEEALANVKRTDIPLEENLKLAKKYAEKYNKHGKLEMIMGLPGSTLNDFYKEMDLVLHTKFWDWNRGPLSVLPATELANPLYQKLHKIKTAKVGITENEDNDITFYSNCVLTKFKSPQEFVVESYSFTREEWKEMFFMNYAQRAVGPRLKADQTPSVEMRKFYQSIQSQEWFKNIKTEIDKIAAGERLDQDFLLFDGLRIEDWVEKHLNGLDN